MSRSGYIDDCDDNWAMICWSGVVARALGGKRGQVALREILDALNALPEHVLCREELVNAKGQCCTLGALGRARGLDMGKVDPYDYDAVAEMFNVAPAFVREIMYHNDESYDEYMTVHVEICGPMRPGFPHYEQHRRTMRMRDTRADAKRWSFMRAWVSVRIKQQEKQG